MDTPRYLVIMPLGIGDAISSSSSAIEQIILHDPMALGRNLFDHITLQG